MLFREENRPLTVVSHEVDLKSVDFSLANRFNDVFVDDDWSFGHERRLEFSHDFFVVWSELGVTSDTIGSRTDGVLKKWVKTILECGMHV